MKCDGGVCLMSYHECVKGGLGCSSVTTRGTQKEKPYGQLVDLIVY